METGSTAFLICGEVGLQVFDLGISYHLSFLRSPGVTYTDADDYVHESAKFRRGAKAFYALRLDGFHLIPELGYVFLDEDASMHDVYSERPDRYSEEYKDEGDCYGLSVRVRIRPVLKAHWWLYGSYVHDNLDIQADNYHIALQLGDELLGPPDPGWDGPDIRSGYFSLGARWLNKTDGRSEWFVTFEFTCTIGLL
ncbi:MAG: hypothetical protein JSV10_07610 [Candidatus Zixiibacteriota bacterium]|nr:MAG: hypothetical protein JSV10_07610 [candidate division Zixibacteria bacterium]